MMEPLPFCDIGSITHCKSIESIVMPMAAQFCQLIISIECEGVEGRQTLAGLTEVAEGLARATEDLARIAKRRAEDSEDEILKLDLSPAAESVLASGKNILLSAQKLHIQPDIRSHTDELIASARRILVSTLKILQIEDKAAVRRIVQASHWLLDCLVELESAGTMLALLSSFRWFSEALILLNNLTGKRILDLKDHDHQKNLSQNLQILQKCVPMLHTATHSHLKHPQNEQVSIAKRYILDLTDKTVRDLISLVTYPSSNETVYEHKASFSQQLHQLVELLSNPTPAKLCNGSVDFVVSALLFYCMFVAESSSQETKLKLLRHCHTLSELREELSAHLSDCAKGNVQLWKPLEPNMHQHCNAMRAELENLDQTLVSSILYQILDTFTHAGEHLKRLIKAALELSLARSPPPEEDAFLADLQPPIAAFHSHADQMRRVAHMVLARCTHSKTSEDIQNSVSCLNTLSATIVPLLVEVSQSPQGAEGLEKLQTLYQAWISTTENLLACADDFVNVEEFLDVCFDRIEQDREFCERTSENQLPEMFSHHANDLCAQANHVVQVITRYVAKKQDPIFRNGLLALIKQLENSIKQARKARNYCLEKPFSTEARSVFSDKIQCIVDSVCNVRRGLDGYNHPDILSPLREHVRSQPNRKGLNGTDQQQLNDPDSNKENQEEDGDSFLEYLSKPLPLDDCKEVPLARRLHNKGRSPNHNFLTVIREVVAAAKKHDISEVNCASSNLLELANSCIEAAKEAHSTAPFQESEQLQQYSELRTLTSSLIRLSRDTARNCATNIDGLLEVAILLSDELDKVKKDLERGAGIWYIFSQQLFCKMPTRDFPSNARIFSEAVQRLSDIVQLSGEIYNFDVGKDINAPAGVLGSYSEIQTKFSRVDTNTKNLIKKATSYHNNQPSRVLFACIEGGCLLWSVGVYRLLRLLDRFIGENMPAELKSMMQLTPDTKQQRMASILECSLRLQGGANMSAQCCVDQNTKLRIQLLKQEIQDLTEDLAQTADACNLSPTAARHHVRIELLQRQLSLKFKILLSCLQHDNKEYAGALQGFLSLAASATTASETKKRDILATLETQTKQIIENIHTAKISLKQTFGTGMDIQSQESLISMADYLALLISDLFQKARQMVEDPNQGGVNELENIVQDWSVRAHFMVAQLEAMEGVDKGILDLIKQCLQKSEAPRLLNRPKVSFYHTERELPEEETIGQGRNTYASAASQALSEGKEGLKVKKELEKCDDDPFKHSEPTNAELPIEATTLSIINEPDIAPDAIHPIVQVTQEMERQMSYLVQYLNKEGPIQTKDQCIASAKQIASSGQEFAKFAQIIAKNCLDRRCATELSSVVPQIHTISNQLTIISSVKAATSSARSADEALVKNAENLINTVLRTLKAAEAACIRGFQQVSPEADDAEMEVAAFCTQWRRTLLQHRETHGGEQSETDELGLRKVIHSRVPTLMSMVHMPIH